MSEPRTKGEALLDVSYGARLHFLHCRLYKHARTTLTLVSLASGMSAFALALQLIPGGVGIMGFLVAACSIIDAQCNFADRAVRHAHWRAEHLDLLARSESMSLAEIDAEWRRIKKHIDDEVGSLCAVAMNDNLRTHGFESEMRKETRMQRLMRALA